MTQNKSNIVNFDHHLLVKIYVFTSQLWASVFANVPFCPIFNRLKQTSYAVYRSKELEWCN